MKANILVLALLCLSLSLMGQIQIGVKGIYSVDMTSETSKEFAGIDPVEISDIGFDGNNSRTGIGLSLYTENKHLFVSSDMLYSSSGRNFSLRSQGLRRVQLDPGFEYKTKENQMRLNLNAGVKVKDFKLGVGPEFSYLVKKEETLSSIEDVTATDKKLQAGFSFLAGCKLSKHLHLDLKYTFIFEDVSDEFKFESIPLDMRRNSKFLEVGLGFYL